MYANRLKSSPYFNEVFKAAQIILSIFNYLFKCMITNKIVIFWVGLTVPIGPTRPKAFVDLGRPIALQTGLEATGPGPGPGQTFSEAKPHGSSHVPISDTVTREMFR
jgi:hypothetical protein